MNVLRRRRALTCLTELCRAGLQLLQVHGTEFSSSATIVVHLPSFRILIKCFSIRNALLKEPDDRFVKCTIRPTSLPSNLSYGPQYAGCRPCSSGRAMFSLPPSLLSLPFSFSLGLSPSLSLPLSYERYAANDEMAAVCRGGRNPE